MTVIIVRTESPAPKTIAQSLLFLLNVYMQAVPPPIRHRLITKKIHIIT